MISADRFASSMPGSLKNDTTIVPEYAPEAQGAVVTHRYKYAAIFPVELIVIDGGARSSSVTAASIR